MATAKSTDRYLDKLRTYKEGWAEFFYKKPCHESISRAKLLIYIGRNIIIRFKEPEVICDEDGIVELCWVSINGQKKKELGIVCGAAKAEYSTAITVCEGLPAARKVLEKGFLFYPYLDQDLIGLFQWVYKEEPKT